MNRINCLVVVMETECVSCEVRTVYILVGKVKTVVLCLST
jgi:hypothetical protein